MREGRRMGDGAAASDSDGGGGGAVVSLYLNPKP